MNKPRNIAFGKPWITESERNAVLEVLAGDILTHGPQAHAFEKEFAAFMGSDAHCLTTSSGMAALHLSYWQLGIGPGDEVIVPAQTHVATVHAVEFVGAKPVFVDCDRATGNIDPAKIEGLVTKKTKAIGVVHFDGIPCDMEKVMGIADRHALKVVEDCALAVGSRFNDKHAGLFGDAAIFSFYPVKHITTGDGGMFATRHPELAAKVAKARAFGVDRSFSERAMPGMYDVPTLGINYRMSDINAAIGRKQLERIDTILSKRRANFEALKQPLSRLKNVTVLDSDNPLAQQSYYCLTAVFEDITPDRRIAVVAALKTAGIGTSVYYPHPVPRLTYYRNKYGWNPVEYPNAIRISDKSIAFPVGPHLDANDMDYIAGTLELILKEHN
jgi:perosamine synthetase